jgi:hypothetical protein
VGTKEMTGVTSLQKRSCNVAKGTPIGKVKSPDMDIHNSKNNINIMSWPPIMASRMGCTGIYIPKKRKNGGGTRHGSGDLLSTEYCLQIDISLRVVSGILVKR